MRQRLLCLGLIVAALLAACTTPPSQPTGWIYGEAEAAPKAKS